MSDSPFDKILDCISERLGDSGGGMPTGAFVLVAEVLDGDGCHATYIGTPGDQPTHRSMGLVEFVRESLATEARIQMMSLYEDEED